MKKLLWLINAGMCCLVLSCTTPVQPELPKETQVISPRQADKADTSIPSPAPVSADTPHRDAPVNPRSVGGGADKGIKKGETPPAKSHAVHEHGSPDQVKTDSIKAAKTREKMKK